MSICWLLENDTALGKFSRYLLQGLIDPSASLTAALLLDLGPDGRFPDIGHSLRKRYLGNGVRGGLSQRGPDMNYTKQGRDVSSLTLIPNEMIIVQHIQTTSRSSFHNETNMTSCSSIEPFRQRN